MLFIPENPESEPDLKIQVYNPQNVLLDQETLEIINTCNSFTGLSDSLYMVILLNPSEQDLEHASQRDHSSTIWLTVLTEDSTSGLQDTAIRNTDYVVLARQEQQTWLVRDLIDVLLRPQFSPIDENDFKAFLDSGKGLCTYRSGPAVSRFEADEPLAYLKEAFEGLITTPHVSVLAINTFSSNTRLEDHVACIDYVESFNPTGWRANPMRWGFPDEDMRVSCFVIADAVCLEEPSDAAPH